MLELYQFELSHYSEKVRLILDYKELEYRKVEVTPGIGQIDLFRLSGQRQVPVLKDGSRVISDSTAIAHYLDETYPDKPILPTDSKQRGLCLILEQWADEVLGWNVRKALFSAVNRDSSFRAALLPSAVPDVLKNLVSALPTDFLGPIGQGVGISADGAKSDLESVAAILKTQSYLVGDQPTLADFAIAAMSMYVKFPDGGYLDIPPNLKGKGVPGIADDEGLRSFFEWRDRLYAMVRKATVSTNPPPSGGPTPISID